MGAERTPKRRLPPVPAMLGPAMLGQTKFGQAMHGQAMLGQQGCERVR